MWTRNITGTGIKAAGCFIIKQYRIIHLSIHYIRKCTVGFLCVIWDLNLSHFWFKFKFIPLLISLKRISNIFFVGVYRDFYLLWAAWCWAPIAWLPRTCLECTRYSGCRATSRLRIRNCRWTPPWNAAYRCETKFLRGHPLQLQKKDKRIIIYRATNCFFFINSNSVKWA